MIPTQRAIVKLQSESVTDEELWDALHERAEEIHTLMMQARLKDQEIYVLHQELKNITQKLEEARLSSDNIERMLDQIPASLKTIGQDIQDLIDNAGKSSWKDLKTAFKKRALLGSMQPLLAAVQAEISRS